MISSRIHMDYLQPETWTHLGVILSCLNPEKEVLHILKTDTGKFRGITSHQQRIAPEEFLSSGEPEPQKIFSKYGEIEEIRVYTLPGLESYYTKVQDSSVYSMDIDDYLIYLYQMQEQTEGIQIYTRRNKTRCYLEYLKQLIDQNVKDGAFLLWLTNHGELYFNCILEYKGGKLVRLTTSDRYPDAYCDYDEVCLRLKSEYPGSVQCVTIELREFAERIEGFFRKQG
ncbi:hypothetical protein [Anaerocolumna xylanovorans]|uniref:Uncharacterized protein n=1 Tax=Anaerocolumna xylanovorans DSM 12503 TaxID=1121345 RepID=A0A1M7YDA6_9FIRM|nr:hypothetical protein [Anaerocolumna xylanovorans]SHO50488.1 hypothetical protein SAMN02745217_02743 [Anaerocolumna xylanovorans DSM 12503]